MAQDIKAPTEAAQAASLPEGISEQDFEAIEDAVMETARGRWFLKEYARRMRAAETEGLLEALKRIERGVAAQSGASVDGVFLPNKDMDRIAGIGEKLLDVVWYMRERGFDGSICEAIDTEVRELGRLAGRALVHDPREGAGRQTILSGEDLPERTSLELTAVERPAIAPPDAEPQVSGKHFVAPEALPVASAPAVEAAGSAEPAPVVESASGIESGVAGRTLSQRISALAHIDALPLTRKLALFA